jgi:hypothetical protein
MAAVRRRPADLFNNELRAGSAASHRLDHKGFRGCLAAGLARNRKSRLPPPSRARPGQECCVTRAVGRPCAGG